MKYALGVDISLRGLGAVLLAGDGDGEEFRKSVRLRSKPTGKGIRARMNRYQSHASELFDWLGCGESGEKIDVVSIAVEGYAYNAGFMKTDPKTGKKKRVSNSASMTGLAELCGILLSDLAFEYPEPIPFFAVAPATLKKFSTGKGNASKAEMIMHIMTRWDVAFGSDDEYDAYGLARMAAIRAGLVLCETEIQREAIHTVYGDDFEPEMGSGNRIRKPLLNKAVADLPF